MANPFDDLIPGGVTTKEPNPFDDIVGIKPVKEDLKTITPNLPQYLKYKVGMDKANAERSVYGREAMWGRMKSKDALVKGRDAQEYWTNQAGPYKDYNFTEAPVAFVAGETAALLPYMISSSAEGLKYGLTLGMGFGTITAIGGQAGPQVLVPEELLTVPAAFAGGMNVGMHYGVMKHTLDREGGSLYLDLLERGVSERLARPTAITAGTIIGIIEMAQLKLIAKGFKTPLAQLLKSSIARNGITQAVGRYTRTVGVELLEEELQEITSLTAETLSTWLEGGEAEIPTGEEWATRIVETAKRAGAGLAVITLPGGAVDVAAQAKKVKVTKKEAAVQLLNKEISELKIEVGGEEIKLEALEEKPVKEKVKPEGLTRKELIRLDELSEEALLGELEETKEAELIGLEKQYQKFGAKPEVESFVKRIKEVREKFTRPETITKEEIKVMQSEITNIIKGLDLDAKDKAKFLTSIKNVTTPITLQREIDKILLRTEKLVEVAEKRVVNKLINRELKYTKPIKAGDRRIGKYDYQTNKMFDEVRELKKSTQEAAQFRLDAMPKENLSYTDLIKTRMLSLMANGTAASAELYQQVLNDVLAMKQVGIETKSEADFNKRLARTKATEEVSTAISKVKGDAKSIVTRIINVYRNGFSNIYSMLNSIAGKEVAEKLDPEPLENDKNIAIFNKVKQATTEIAKRLGLKGRHEVLHYLQGMTVQKFEMVDLIDGLRTEITKLEIIDIYNAIKNDLIQERYYKAFGKDQIDGLINNLTQSEMLAADYMQEVVQSYREILNKRSIEITGRDLGFVENYWPSTSEFVQSVTDDIRMQGETPSALKARSESAAVIPVPKDAWLKFMKHITQGEHVEHLSRPYESLKRTFQDRKVKNQIINKFGEDIYKTIMAQIDNISLNKETVRLDAVSNFIGRRINNWVTAKVAINDSVFAKQLISIINYSENMPVGAWAKGFFKGIATPKKTFDFMWKNSGGFLEERFNRGYSEALKEAVKGSDSIIKNKRNWTKGLTALARTGDIAAIIYGGNSMVQYELAQGKSMDEAFAAFRRSTLKSQQSGLSSGLSQFQNSRNPLARLFLAFKNTANQYFRKQMDAIVSLKNKEISPGQFAKVTTIYSVINPLLYAFVGYALTQGWKGLGSLFFGTDEEPPADSLLDRLFIQLAINPFQAIPLLDDMAQFAVRKMIGKKNYKALSTPLFDDIERAFQKAGKKEITLFDFFEIFGTAVEIETGLPVHTALRRFKHLFGKPGEKEGELKPI